MLIYYLRGRKNEIGKQYAPLTAIRRRGTALYPQPRRALHQQHCRTRRAHAQSQAKKSGCFRTKSGADNFAVIRSCLDTLHKQGHRMIDVLRHAFSGYPLRPACG